MPEHKIAVYEDGGTPKCGLIITPPDRKNRIELMDLRGNTKLVPTGKIFLTLPHTVSGANQAALAELSSLYNDALDTDDDIESMWELVRDEGTSVALPDLAELLWENPSNRQLLGLFLSLYGDSVWFKRKGDLWEPKSERHVAERLAQIEKQRQTEQLRENFGRHIDQILSSETTLDEKQWEGFLSQLRSLALLGDDFQGPAFLGDMVKELSRKHHFSSAPLWYGAFTILERLGIFLHHEDLDLLRFNPPPDLEDYSLLPSDPRSNSTLTLVVTIDDASTRDVDDAIACSPCSDGWKVSVCIADPASVIEPGSTLDLHTRRRATSLYRPDGTHHMLPERLSCDLLSLGEGVARSCLIFSAHIDPQGRVSNQEIIEGCVTVTHRLTYDQVDDLLKDHIESPLGTTLGDLTTIADLLYHGRQEAGCLEFPFPEAKITIEADSPRIAIINTESPSRRLVKEFMILANTIAAAFASDHQIPVIFTSQPPPDEPLPPQTNLADAYAILRKLKKAEKSTSPAPHTSLGVSAYVQASSPLRRYGDLLAHYQIKAFLKNGPLPFGRDELVEIMGHQDAVSAEASRMERNRTRYWQLVYLSEHGDEIFDALVLAVLDNRNGGTVLLPSLAMRCNVAFQTRLAPGDVIRTQVISVNPRKDELHLKHVV